MSQQPTEFSATALAGSPEVFSSLQPPARLGVFGDPVAHSVSPAMHNAALAEIGISEQYVRLHATPEEFPSAARALATAGFRGANVTIPHKGAALEACASVEEYARLAGAVNTLVVEDDGTLSGYNTDGPGLVRALRDEFYTDLRDLRVMVLGAGGGAGRAIAVQCAMERCERLVLLNRTFDKAQSLAQELAPRFRSERLLGPAERCLAVPWEDEFLAEQLAATDLLINATALGMKRTDPAPIPGNLLTPNLMVFDTVYARGTTRLMEDALAAGARVAGGLSMLLHQGALSFEIWFNRTAPLDAMKKALREL